MAYELSDDLAEDAKTRLDEREKRYEMPMDVTFNPRCCDGSLPATITARCYFAPLSGPLFLGEAEPAAMAQQIMSARGPSGHNLEYLVKLWDFMCTEVGPDSERDAHLSSLIELCCSK